MELVRWLSVFALATGLVFALPAGALAGSELADARAEANALGTELGELDARQGALAGELEQLEQEYQRLAFRIGELSLDGGSASTRAALQERATAVAQRMASREAARRDLEARFAAGWDEVYALRDRIDELEAAAPAAPEPKASATDDEAHEQDAHEHDEAVPVAATPALAFAGCGAPAEWDFVDSSTGYETEAPAPTASPACTAGVPTGGSLLWPVAGSITSTFGPRWGKQHEGIDIGAPAGTPVATVAAGTVVQAGPYGGYGNLVLVDHGTGLTTAYAHLSAIHVTPGQVLGGGHVVGLVGCTGHCTGDHLHFETRLATGAVDPMTIYGTP